MDAKDLKKILGALDKSVADAIEKHVNGKIRNMDQKLDAYIEKDMVWKDKVVQPLVDAYSSANNVGTFLIWISKIVMAIGAIVAGGFATGKFFGKW